MGRKTSAHVDGGLIGGSCERGPLLAWAKILTKYIKQGIRSNTSLHLLIEDIQYCIGITLVLYCNTGDLVLYWYSIAWKKAVLFILAACHSSTQPATKSPLMKECTCWVLIFNTYWIIPKFKFELRLDISYSQWKTASNIQSGISQKPFIGSYLNLKLELRCPNRILQNIGI